MVETTGWSIFAHLAVCCCCCGGDVTNLVIMMKMRIDSHDYHSALVIAKSAILPNWTQAASEVERYHRYRIFRQTQTIFLNVPLLTLLGVVI
jgi:hypothetical protein